MAHSPPSPKPDNPSEARQTASDGKLTVVGIGASAGGLTALQAFFDALAADSGMAFVVVTHMDPERESLLPQLLQRHTAMPVRQVSAMMAVEPNHVYVIPPGRRIALTDTHLDVEAFEEPRGQRFPIDHFFRSMAAVHRDPVAIILSGGGTDGAVGVKAIKEHGGLLMVQDPAEAEHDSMPRATIATGLVDVILPAAELASKLVEYQRNGVRLPQDPEALTTDEMTAIFRILTQVQAHTGHDFSQYKRSTLLRRIRRRMQIVGHTTLDAYLDHQRYNRDETRALFNDLLIGVTNFFRDKDAWQALAEQVIPQLFEVQEKGGVVRVWSIGCATGEEAYTLAMLLVEHADRLKIPASAQPTLQVFATDLDDGSLTLAREGFYPEAIEADVSPERLERFFRKEGNYYRVNRTLRDVVLFSNHSVLRDPPFSRLDLISCRNLLIYLNRDLQESIFQIFHYALNAERFLFLGSSESAEMADELFRTLDKRCRIYQARPARGTQPHIPALPLTVRRRDRVPRPSVLPGQRRPTSAEAMDATADLHLAVLEQLTPPSALVDEAYHVIHLSEAAGRYLQHPGGTMTSDLLKLVRPALQFELRTALFQAFEHDKTVVSRPLFVQFNGAARRVTLAVRPRLAANRPEDDIERVAVVFFLEDEIADEIEKQRSFRDPAQGEPIEGHAATLLAQLEGEVQRLRERLQVTTEEYESSNEELKAANEELQSINEEYRSTTEELETSKEELQSVNEEIQTVNAELKNKLEESSRARSDLENLLSSTEIATLFLDRSLRIQRYTPGTAELFNVRAGDRGRPIDHLTSRVKYDALAEDARRVLHELVSIEREVQDQAGRWFLARLRPYRTEDNRIDGVVLTFIDISELKRTEQTLRVTKEYGDKIVATVREGLLVLQPDLTVEFANESFYQMFEVVERETIGAVIFDVGNGQWDIPDLRTLLAKILPEQHIFNNYRVEHTFDSIGHRIMLLNARRLDQIDRILLAIEDITERERYESELRALTETLEERVIERTAQVETLASQLTMAEHAERDRIAHVLHDHLQQRLYAIQMQLDLMESSYEAGDAERLQEDFVELKSWLNEAIQTTRQLSVDLSPPILHDEGLTEAIGWLVSQMEAQLMLQIEVQADESFRLESEALRVLLFQAVRELLFNVVKHAGVDEAQVKLAHSDGHVRLEVSDRGSGFNVAAVTGDLAQDGMGLKRIRQRLSLFDGRLDIESTPGQGTRVVVLAPVT